jgi:hypothetical protein
MQAKQAIITLLLAASLGLAGCEQERPADEEGGEPRPGPRVIQQLNELAIALIKPIRSGDSSDPDAIRGDTGDVARTMALLNVAMHDAVIGALRPLSQTREDPPYKPLLVNARPPRYSPEVLAASAGAEILKTLFTTQERRAQINAVLKEIIGQGGSYRGGEQAAIGAGKSIARQVLSARRDDVPTEPLLQEDRNPGGFNESWRSQYAAMKPFVLDRPDQFRAPPPPALDSKKYFEAWDEVRRIGARNSTERDAAATEIARVWNGGVNTARPTGAWFEAAIAVADSQGLSLQRTARLFGLLGVTIADAMITSWDTKYEYFFWRPAQAIQMVNTDDDDGNPHTEPNPEWRPLSESIGGSPEYTSGTATFAAAASTLLSAFFGRDTIPFILHLQKDIPDLECNCPRQYRAFSEAAEEAGKSRIYNGIHFSFANEQGMIAGKQVAQQVLAKHPAN